MIVRSPLKKHDIRPNLRKVSLPDKNTSSRNNSGGRRSKQKIQLPKFKPWKVILGTFILGALGFLYLTHVFATQELLEEVQALETEYNQVRTEYDELKLRYDRMVGPAEIYRKAEEQGFINGGPADKVITIED